MTQEKDAQAVQKAQASAAKAGAEQEKSREEARELQRKAAQAASEAGGVAPTDAVDPNSPYQSYDFMPLSELVALADERGVTINPDVLKAHLVTELRAHQSGATSASTRLGAR